MTSTESARLLARIGDVEVWRVPEIVIPTSVRWLLPDAPRDQVEAAKAWMQPDFMDASGYLLQSIHTYLLKTPELAILIDTGVGNDKQRGGAIPAFNLLETPFLARLASAGVQAEDVDTVLCTHLHTDHVGWDAYLDGERWTPTFANARHLFARPEYEHFKSSLGTQAASNQLWQDSIRPVEDASRVDLVDPDHQVCAEVRLEPSFGHTPGHVSIRLDSRGQSAVFIGDAMHSPIQALFPMLRSALGGPEGPARDARLAILERYADSGTLVFGAHFAWPCGGLVRREGAAFRFEGLSPPQVST